MSNHQDSGDLKFLSTPSARRATRDVRGVADLQQISIHALCEEGDGDRFLLRHIAGISIHALCEEGDLMVQRPACALANFYPRPLRGGRPMLSSFHAICQTISIHALCEEGDSSCCRLHRRLVQFLSTPSARRATYRCTPT